MEYRKTLIGAASILALSVGLNQVEAAVPQPQTEAKVPVGRDLTSASFTDPLLDLISLTQGSFTEEAVQAALTSMYGNASQAQIERMPELLNNIAGLGLGASVLETSRQTLIDIVISAEAVEEASRALVVAQLEDGAGSIKLAQQEEILRRRGRRDPTVVGQTPPGRDPGVVGQVGGGGY